MTSTPLQSFLQPPLSSCRPSYNPKQFRFPERTHGGFSLFPARTHAAHLACSALLLLICLQGRVHLYESGKPSCRNKQPLISVQVTGEQGGLRVQAPLIQPLDIPRLRNTLLHVLQPAGRQRKRPPEDWEGRFRGQAHKEGRLLYLTSVHSPPVRKWSVSKKVTIEEQSAYVSVATSSWGQAPHHLFPPGVLRVSSITAPGTA